MILVVPHNLAKAPEVIQLLGRSIKKITPSKKILDHVVTT